MAEFTFPGGEVGWLSVHRGEVAGLRKWSETHVSSSGGGGYLHNGSGYIQAAKVSSSAVEKSEFWIKSRGEEVCLRLNVPVRDGHDVSLAWGNSSQEKTGNHLFFMNHSTEQYYFLDPNGCFENLYNREEVEPLRRIYRRSLLFVLMLSAVIAYQTRSADSVFFLVAGVIYCSPNVRKINKVRRVNREKLMQTLVSLCRSAKLGLEARPTASPPLSIPDPAPLRLV